MLHVTLEVSDGPICQEQYVPKDHQVCFYYAWKCLSRSCPIRKFENLGGDTRLVLALLEFYPHPETVTERSDRYCTAILRCPVYKEIRISLFASLRLRFTILPSAKHREPVSPIRTCQVCSFVGLWVHQ